MRGKALPERLELVFRGDERFKIPFSGIRDVLPKDGELCPKTADRLIVLELGEKAGKWREKSPPKSVLAGRNRCGRAQGGTVKVVAFSERRTALKFVILLNKR